MTTIKAQVDEWKRRLIDLTRRNRLLFFKAARNSLQVVVPTADEVFGRLVVNERAWKFFIPPNKPQDQAGESTDRQTLFETESDSAPTPEPDELVCQTREPGRLESALRSLYRRARSDFEERGVRVLHVAFGILEWQDPREDQKSRSPILLVPIQLIRESVNDPFEISLAEDAEIVLNPALEVKFWNDFRIKLPPPPDDWDEVKLAEYLVEASKQVEPQGWKVLNESWVSLFSFHKLVIYQDLNTNGQLICQHSIARALAEEVEPEEVFGGEIPEPKELDTLINPRESFLVLDADSSQVRCAEAVKRGTSLVLQGPPGTGKSQTITNIIAESVAGGRTVLFVSEKMAALEVVYKRLRQANLGHYCLELHSHKANRKKVVNELYRCYLEALKPTANITEEEFTRLIARRQQLNDYVRALHVVREPLCRSAFDVLAELARLDGYPYVPTHGDVIESLKPSLLDLADQLVERLARVWHVVAEGNAFPWRGCVEQSYGLGTSTKFLRLIERCEVACTTLTQKVEQLAEYLGCEQPTQLGEARWLLETARILLDTPGPERNWLTCASLEELIREAKRYAELSAQHRSVRARLAERYNQTFCQTPLSLKSSLLQSLNAISSLLGRSINYESIIVSERATILAWASDLVTRAGDWIREADVLCGRLDLNSQRNLDALKRVIRVAELCCDEDRPAQSWLEPEALETVSAILPRLRQQMEARTAAQTQLLQEYDEAFLSLNIESLIDLISLRYSSVLRWVKPGFYRLRKQIRSCRKDGKNPINLLQDLNRARELKRLEERIGQERPLATQLLGEWYRDYDTDYARVERAIRVAKELVELTGGKISDALRSQTCLGTVPQPVIRDALERLKRSISVWEQDTSVPDRYLRIERLPATHFSIRQTELPDLLDWGSGLVKALRQFIPQVEVVESSLLSRISQSPAEILDDLTQLALLRELEAKISSEADRLREIYGRRFSGIDTDWDDIQRALDWVGRLRRHLGQQPISPLLIERACQNARVTTDVDTLQAQIAEFVTTFGDFSGEFEQDQRPGFLMTAEERLAARDARENSAIQESQPEILSGRNLGAGSFIQITRRLSEMTDRVEEIRDWIDYRSLEKDFIEAGLNQLKLDCEKQSDLRSEQLGGIARRSLLSAWIDALFNKEPVLGRFRAQDHESLITEFRHLDRRQFELASHRIIVEAEKRKPRSRILQRGGEAALLAHEANKKKRHLPIRKLFTAMPNLLTSLKPCILMSPLSVSQFLDPQQMRFDLVIFDEASQICPEDAIGAIYRGQQLVICGDNKQLPPTAFFDQGVSDDFDDQDTSEVLEHFDSILDKCMAIGMPVLPLLWHYRSRHESLIAFSNHRFYGNRLVTFPASNDKHPSLGIQFRYVQDGVYDRGGRRDNPREAEVIVDLVVQYLAEQPDRSLGVVAFSVAQRNAIEDRLEQVLREHPELEHHFKPDNADHCFVKNLESVQGDERDVMIFSVGYGRDQQGRLTMNFGPLNSEGGERRLNVAVTRARDKVIVVSSIRSSDFDLSATQAPGVLALYHYLDYSERGPEALSLQHPGSTGEFESPLEQDVAAAIRSLGYNTVPQVGCSEFRVDLGITDPAAPGRFILGVECDGVTYHAAYTARDRDRLRQEVLERLGWRIHRIWSPDWAHRRGTEIQRLREAIERSLALGREDKQVVRSLTTPATHLPIVSRLEIEEPKESNEIPGWAVKYVVCKPNSRPPSGVEFHEPRAKQILVRMLQEVVDLEGPIHIEIAAARLARRWNLQRIGDRMMGAVHQAARQLVSQGGLKRTGKFLWPTREEFVLRVRCPDPEDEASVRKIEFIASEEIELAITGLIREAISLPEDESPPRVARIFGFDRTGRNIQEHLERTLEKMVTSGILTRQGDRLSLNSTS